MTKPGPKPIPLEVRFARYVPRGDPDECWEYAGGRGPFGYGRFYDQRVRRSVPAHRIGWELANGALPKGAQVCHRCDNPPCCNPAHLFLCDQAANNADMRAKGRAGGNRRRGEESHSCRLTDAQIAEIRDAYAAGGVTQRQLADRYGVTQCHIHNIVRFKQRLPAAMPLPA